MLGDEDVVVAELIGELNLFQRLLVDVEFIVWTPLIIVEGSGRLELEHQTEFHHRTSFPQATVSTRNSRPSGRDLRPLYICCQRLSTAARALRVERVLTTCLLLACSGLEGMRPTATLGNPPYVKADVGQIDAGFSQKTRPTTSSAS